MVITGGNAGEPGAGGTYTEQGNNGQYITKQGRPGRKGKGGKKGNLSTLLIPILMILITFVY